MAAKKKGVRAATKTAGATTKKSASPARKRAGSSAPAKATSLPAGKGARSSARRKKTAARKTAGRSGAGPRARAAGRNYCHMPEMPERVLDKGLPGPRTRAIIVNENKWVNGTVIHYWFFDGKKDGEWVWLSNGRRRWASWVGEPAQQDVVRKAFEAWKKLGIGLEFEEVQDRADAEVRIGFMQGDGSWSYIGTYVLKIATNDRTMNFGWNLVGDMDTAMHEIGHTLGLPHEHQNPYAGIVWDEEAVYAALAKPPNNWDRQKTYYNIIRKISPDTVQGSNWDPDSIMHYPFEAGLIEEPEEYASGLWPEAGLSQRDQAWVRSFYPPLGAELKMLVPGRSEPLPDRSGEQQNFRISPRATRYYDMRTFGACDTLMVLFTEVNGKLRYRSADDDSGEDRNASLRVRLYKGRDYVLRVRVKWAGGDVPPSVMMW